MNLTVLIILYCLFQPSGSDTIHLEQPVKPLSFMLMKPSHSGDGQHQIVKLELPEPVSVCVTDSAGLPVEGVEVLFTPLSQPSKAADFIVYPESVKTDSLGYATARVKLGNLSGDYQITARIAGFPGKDIQVFSFYARKSNWFFMLLIGFFGGLGLFFLGMKMLSEGMQNSAGNRMRVILSSLTHNRLIAFGAGAFITTAIQSSNATCAMLVSFVHSQLMKFRQTIGVILGTAIGTTITLQIIAFKLTDYSLLIVTVGFILYFFTRKQKVKYIGETILGFGILFFGMYVMSEAMYPLRTYHPFINILYKLENPFLGMLVGALFTALIQSSGAFLGIIIVLSTQGLITLESAIPLLLGSNIGTAFTAILASLNTSPEAKKVAVALTLIKVIGVLLVIWWIPPFTRIVEWISPKGTSGVNEMNQLAEIMPRLIANAHTTFNVLISLLFIPLTGKFSGLIDRLLPERVSADEAEEKIETTYLDYNIKNTPSLGLNLAKEEALRVGRFILEMVQIIIKVFTEKDEKVIKHLETRKKQVDFLMSEIDRYLMRISRGNINDQHVNESFQIMYTVKEFDQIAENISKMLVKRAQNWLEGHLEFSDAGKAELIEYHGKVIKQLSRAIDVFREMNLEKAHLMKTKYKKYRHMAIELEKHHYERLREEIAATVSSSETHLELIALFRSITAHSTNIARMFIESGTDKNDTVDSNGSTENKSED